MIAQVAACNPGQEEVADGMALNFDTFVYFAHRSWRYVDADRDLVNAFRMFYWGSGGPLEESARKIFSNATRRLPQSKINDIMRHCT